MQVISGKVIQPGLMIGKARLVQTLDWTIPLTQITRQDVDSEIKLLDQAISGAGQDLERQLLDFKGNESDKEILRSHQLILQDPELIPAIRRGISEGLVTAAYAVQEAFTKVREHFQGLDNKFLAQRAEDYRDMEHRLLAGITGRKQEDLHGWQPDQIAVLAETTPSLVTDFAHQGVPAFCAVTGGYTSHASILARSLKITAIASLEGLLDKVADGDTIILDALDGKVIISPDESTLKQYRELQDRQKLQEELSRQNAGLPAQTLDGRRIKLRCNLDIVEAMARPGQLGSDGVGLFRTEFLYLGSDSLPSEDYQFEIYKKAAESVAPHSLILRSFDLGGDKLSHLMHSEPEENPQLGCRGIRFSLAHPDILRTQIRAVLRASLHGSVKLMFPMVAGLSDFLRAREFVQSCKTELDSESIGYDPKLPLGVMVEIPSAALCADELARHCDFLSIGTNDLVQYTLAADRNNSAIGDYYTTHHPAVLQLLRLTLDAGIRQGKPVSICGEMASRPEYIPLLVGMGFTELSVGISAWEKSRDIIRRCDARLAELVYSENLASLGEIENLIYDVLKPYYSL
jgi:phosphotransferase system enzyme I (PtsI)